MDELKGRGKAYSPSSFFEGLPAALVASSLYLMKAKSGLLGKRTTDLSLISYRAYKRRREGR